MNVFEFEFVLHSLQVRFILTDQDIRCNWAELNFEIGSWFRVGVIYDHENELVSIYKDGIWVDNGNWNQACWLSNTSPSDLISFGRFNDQSSLMEADHIMQTQLRLF